MLSYTYKHHNKFALTDKPKPEIIGPRDAVVRVTMSSICSSDLHIKHGSVPRAVPGITVGHEMVGIDCIGEEWKKPIGGKIHTSLIGMNTVDIEKAVDMTLSHIE